MNFSLLVSAIILFFAIGISPIYSQKFIQDSQLETHPINIFNRQEGIDSVKVYCVKRNTASANLPQGRGRAEKVYYFKYNKLIKVKEYLRGGLLRQVYEFNYSDSLTLVKKYIKDKKLNYVWYYLNDKIIKEEKFKNNGDVIASWLYKYESDTLLKSTQKYNGNNEFMYEILQDYDNEGRLLGYKRLQNKVILNEQLFTYVNNGKILIVKGKGMNSWVIQSKYLRSVNSNITIFNEQWSDDTSDSTIFYFDDNYLLKKKEVFNADILFKEEFKYDDKLNLINHFEYKNDRLIWKDKLAYNDDQLISIKRYQVTKRNNILTFEYYKNLNLIGNPELELLRNMLEIRMEVYRYYYY